MKRLFAVLSVAVLLLLSAPLAVQAGLHVAIWGDDDSDLADVQSKVFASGQFDAVDVVNIYSGVVPSLADALAYDAIMVYGGGRKWGTSMSQAAGDVLADYCDAGGGLVAATFVLGSNLGSWILQGQFDDSRYQVMVPVTSQTSGRQTLGTVYNWQHPLMSGVDVFDGGSSSYQAPITQLTTDSVLLAEWSGSRPLVAYKELLDMGRRVDLNFYPPSSDVRSDFWDASTDGDLLMSNALAWAAVPEPATLSLLAFGLGALFVRRRRK